MMTGLERCCSRSASPPDSDSLEKQELISLFSRFLDRFLLFSPLLPSKNEDSDFHPVRDID